MEPIFTLLQSASVIGSAYIAWNYGSHVKGIINSPSIKPYKDNIFKFNKSSIINEDTFCGMTSSLVGAIAGRHFWFVCLPVVLYEIEKRHGDDIRTFLDKKKK